MKAQSGLDKLPGQIPAIAQKGVCKQSAVTVLAFLVVSQVQRSIGGKQNLQLLFRGFGERLSWTGVTGSLRGIDGDKAQVSPIGQADGITVKNFFDADLFIILRRAAFSRLGRNGNK